MCVGGGGLGYTKESSKTPSPTSIGPIDLSASLRLALGCGALDLSSVL